MPLLALTLGRPTGTGWTAVTDHGERIEVPASAAAGLAPVTGQRVLASLDERGAVVRVTIGGTRVGLPGAGISQRS